MSIRSLRLKRATTRLVFRVHYQALHLSSDGQTPAEWASHVAKGLRCDDSGSPVSTQVETAASLVLMHWLIPMASRLRVLDDIKRAERLTNRMLSLADHLVLANPDDPTPYLMRSHAYAELLTRKTHVRQKDESGQFEPNMRLAYDVQRDVRLLLRSRQDDARHQV